MIKTVLGFTLILFIIPISYLISETPVESGETDIESIVEKVKARQIEILEEVGDAMFMAESIYREIKRDGDLKKEVVSRKRIYARGMTRRHDEYLSMSINGRKLDKKEMEKEVEKGKRDDMEIKLPLTPEGEGHYNFQLIGDDNLNGVDVWIIGFEAKEKKDEYVNGRGYVSKDTFGIVRLELAPAKISRLVENLSVYVDSARIQGYWMPAKFEVDVTIKLSFLYYKRITIEEIYSQFKLNNKFDDSLFESE